jgi:hypothetical protein
MITPKCTHKGCGWVGTPKANEGKASQAVAMHVGRIHTKNIPTYHGPMKRRKRVEANGHTHANGNGHVAIVLPESTRGRVHPVAAEVKKRGYVRRQQSHVANAGTEIQINHCWKCGTNVGALAEGIVLAELIRNDPRIRAKVEKILAKA